MRAEARARLVEEIGEPGTRYLESMERNVADRTDPVGIRFRRVIEQIEAEILGEPDPYPPTPNWWKQIKRRLKLSLTAEVDKT